MAGDEGGRLNACTKNIQIYISLYMSLCISYGEGEGEGRTLDNRPPSAHYSYGEAR